MLRKCVVVGVAALILQVGGSTIAGQEQGEQAFSEKDVTSLLADLVEVGVNVVNPVAPDCMDAVAIRRRFGGRLALWGTVGTALTWDHGTPDQLREEVRIRSETLGPSGLLLSPAYDLDFTPYENVTAFVEAVHEFG